MRATRAHLGPVGFAAIVLLLAMIAPPAPAAALPRYSFEPGQRLVYRGAETMTASRSGMGVERETILSVVRRNADDTWRLIVTMTHTRFGGAGDARRVVHRRHDFHIVDLAADGRLRQRGCDHFDGLDRVTPRLPADAAEATRGWSFTSADIGHRCQLVDRTDDAWTIEITPMSAMNELNGFSSTVRTTIDRGRGIIAEIATRYRHRDRETRTALDRLEEEDRIPASELATLAAEIDGFAEATARYESRLARTLLAGRMPAAAATLTETLAEFEAATSGFRSDTLRARARTLITSHHAATPTWTTRLQKQSRIIGQPAPTFALPDLDGTPRDLAAERGRVVVLDFWYRACGWCVRAMPQIESLSARFAGRPVTVLGVNVDRVRDDARLVVDRLGLTYPSVQADGKLAAAYGVRSYPTLAVVDAEGVVRGVHVGYASTLEEDLAAFIETLLGDS
ncbi:MAG: TlpA family protein disulfide reductase [Phycisphaerales bacterium]|nr:TlpA family protein disulfide reductase [Phycisphaerales bacterium]